MESVKSANSQSLSVTNIKILNFYQTHKHIDFENINLYFIDLLEKLLENNEKLPAAIEQLHITEAFTKPPSYTKDHLNSPAINGEKKMEIILSTICPTDRIIKNNNVQLYCDFILKKQNKTAIMIENKESYTNIDTEVTDIFISAIKQHKCCGIFISQHSGIINKPNFNIEIYNGNILVYLSNCNYDIEKISNSIEIIYTLQNKLEIFNNETNPIISNTLLNEINKEYQLFIQYRENIVKLIKENSNTLIKNIDNFKFETLDKYLSTKFVTNLNAGHIHKCNLCNIYTSKSLKGFAAHKKGCIKKIPLMSSVINMPIIEKHVCVV